MTVRQPGFGYVTRYTELWLHFICVCATTAMTVEHTWDGRATDMINEGKKQAAGFDGFALHRPVVGPVLAIGPVSE